MVCNRLNGKCRSVWNPSIICRAVALCVVCSSIWGCSAGCDRLVDCTSEQEVVAELRGLEESLGYDGIVNIFGKPSEEFNPPSNPDEEFVLYYRCRDDAARGFWIMLHYPEKTYWYSSGGVVDIGAPFCGNRLVEALYAKGAKPSTTGKIILQGSDSGFGSDIKVAITDPSVINHVWKTILNSQNYGVYSACGYRKIEFHSSIDSDTPVATVTLLCENAAAYLEEEQPFHWDAAKGGRDGLYQCHGLNELIEPYLREEYSRRRQVRSGEGSRS
jgi:hypothetical protein